MPISKFCVNVCFQSIWRTRRCYIKIWILHGSCTSRRKEEQGSCKTGAKWLIYHKRAKWDRIWDVARKKWMWSTFLALYCRWKALCIQLTLSYSLGHYYFQSLHKAAFIFYFAYNYQISLLWKYSRTSVILTLRDWRVSEQFWLSSIYIF